MKRSVDCDRFRLWDLLKDFSDSACAVRYDADSSNIKEF